MYWLPALLILPYVVLIFKVYKRLLEIDTFITSTDPVTFVSVVVACRNEQMNLPVLLNNIALQNYPEHLFEVIIVDDKSTDKTHEIGKQFKGITNTIILYNSGEGKKTALRTGIKVAIGELIITTDADCTMGKNWIRTIASFYETNRPDMIICPVQIKAVPGFFGKFQELEYLSLQGITAGFSHSEEATMCNGANLAFKKAAYNNHSENLHDEVNSGDDIFLLHSLKKDKLSKIHWLESSDALVTTKPAPTLLSFLKQRSRWISKGKAYNDRNTIILGTSVFVAITLLISYFIAMLVYPELTGVFLSVLILKSFPDFLILLNTTKRYGKRNLMKWFLPAQVIYPLYVLSVVFYSLIFREK